MFIHSFPRLVPVVAVAAAVNALPLPTAEAMSAGPVASISPECVFSDPLSGQESVQKARNAEDRPGSPNRCKAGNHQDPDSNNEADGDVAIDPACTGCKSRLLRFAKVVQHQSPKVRIGAYRTGCTKYRKWMRARYGVDPQDFSSAPLFGLRLLRSTLE